MTLNIWRFTDGKPGHDSQSIGLCSAIEKLKTCQRFDIAVDSPLTNICNLLLKKFPRGKNLPDPNIIIGAGHKTHLPMLSARHARNGKIIVLMKPSLPLSFFDVCIIPEHDTPPLKDNVITTIGALNPVQYNDNKSNDFGLILLGGPSKHYQWNEASIINQIKTIVSTNKDTRWMIADSPRTPKETLTIIDKLEYENIEVLDYSKTQTGAIQEHIYKAKFIWVSLDSVSMIYESLSSGASVGLLETPQIRDNRVNRAIRKLLAHDQLTMFSVWQKTTALKPNTLKLNEANRCSLLLSERDLLG